MSVSTAISNAFNAPVQWDGIDRLQKLLQSLTMSATDGGRDRSAFGYYANQLQAQAMGYLVVDNTAATRGNDPLMAGVGRLSSDERALFASIHSWFIKLNAHCIGALVGEDFRWPKSIDPYSRYMYTDELPSPAGIWTSQATDQVVTSFARHPAGRVVRALASKMAIPEDVNLQAVLAIDQKIARSGVHDVPTDLKEFLLPSSDMSSERLVSAAILGTIILRASLANLDQLIWQSLLGHPRIDLDDDNVIAVISKTRTQIGSGITLDCILDHRSILVLVGDVVTANYTRNGGYSGCQCLVETLSASFSQETGNVFTFKMRMLDEYLNPYPALLNSVLQMAASFGLVV